jgi:hypothetical protein
MKGETAKQFGLDLVSNHNPDFLATMRHVARVHCTRHGEVTIDDVRQWADLMSYKPSHPNAWGAVFRTGFERIGFRKSTTPSAHSRMVSVWRRV